MKPLTKETMPTTTRTDWFCRAQWGLFFHYLGAPPSSSGGAELTADEWNRRVDAFDVVRLADLAESVQAGFVCLTLGQNSGHYCAPNAAYDRYVGIHPSKCSRRDLMLDLAKELKKRNISAMAYLPSGAPEFDPVAAEKLKWKPFGGRMAEFQAMWEDVIREWSLRWGPLVRGWWIDGVYDMKGMYQQPEAPNAASFAAAMRAGNPESIIGLNPGVKVPIISIDPNEDYTAGETNQPQLIDPPGRWLDGKQFHMLSFLGRFWCVGEPRFTDQQVIELTQSITRYGGVVTWDVPIEVDSSVRESYVQQLRALGAAMAKERAARGDMLEFPPAPQHASIQLTTQQPMMFQGEKTQAARILLRCQNGWPTTISEQIQFWIEPANAATVQPAAVGPMTIAPGMEVQESITVTPEPHAAQTPITLCYQRRQDPRVQRFPVPRRQSVNLQSMPNSCALADVRAALADQPSFRASGDGVSLADIRFGIAGNDLILFAEVMDRRMIQTPMMWDGSCIEIFASPAAPMDFHQLFLTPATSQGAARAGRLAREASAPPRIVPETAIQLTTHATDTGYTMAAVIPLRLLGARAGEAFLLAFSVTGSSAGDQFQRAPLFCTQETQNMNNYALITPLR